MTDIEQVKEIMIPIAKKHGIRKVSLFGSRTRGNDTDKSDYDFLISKGKVDSILSYMAFVNELEEAFGVHVDVITDTSDDEDIIAAARKDEVVLYEYQG